MPADFTRKKQKKFDFLQYLYIISGLKNNRLINKYFSNISSANRQSQRKIAPCLQTDGFHKKADAFLIKTRQ